ncbi:MAG: zinc dependent phospholipase C family protein [Bacteroidales bacterium]|nr:zinc dependent phospholipase C family protein [Bacteroidales bacterium]
MPEGYTHVRVARKAADTAGLMKQIHPAAFCAGANGPDEFFCFEAWKPADKRTLDLPALGSRMHREKTGAFLMSLADHASTQAQKSYALGFISHYITDCTVHPYVAMITQKGQLYDMPGGHGYFEIALDSELHKKDYGTPAVSAAHSNPRLTGTALVQVAQLLQVCLKEVYGVDVGLEALGDSFHHAHFLRALFVSRLGIKKKLLEAAEPLFGGKGSLTGHVSPARLKGCRRSDKEQLPSVWRNPYTGQTCQITVAGLLHESTRRAVTCFLTCRSFWQGRTPRQELERLLGSRSYETGLEDADSRGENPALNPEFYEKVVNKSVAGEE